jgi:hypothetical protein
MQKTRPVFPPKINAFWTLALDASETRGRQEPLPILQLAHLVSENISVLSCAASYE